MLRRCWTQCLSFKHIARCFLNVFPFQVLYIRSISPHSCNTVQVLRASLRLLRHQPTCQDHVAFTYKFSTAFVVLAPTWRIVIESGGTFGGLESPNLFLKSRGARELHISRCSRCKFEHKNKLNFLRLNANLLLRTRLWQVF